MLYRYAAILLCLLTGCNCVGGGEERADRRGVITIVDTLFGWRCNGEFFYAHARPAPPARQGVHAGCALEWDPAMGDSVLNCPDIRPPAAPLESFERDTVILFISKDCPFPEAQTSKNVKQTLEPPPF